MRIYQVVNLSGPADCIPGAIRQQIESAEEQIRTEADRMARMNQEAGDAAREGDFNAVDRFTKLASQASQRWQEAKARIANLRHQLDECEAKYRTPVETPSAFRRVIPEGGEDKGIAPDVSSRDNAGIEARGHEVSNAPVRKPVQPGVDIAHIDGFHDGADRIFRVSHFAGILFCW